MQYVAVVITLALIQFSILGMLVGRARGLFGIKAPATSGNEMFERHFRVHYNTMELLVVFVPASWLFGLYVDPRWAAGLGIIYLVGRIVYVRSYLEDPAKRSLGFGMSVIPTLLLALGALVGAGRAMF